MNAKRIVILGASGFVGTTLTECLQGRAGIDVVPVIHSAGSAWRLARQIPRLVQVDVADTVALAEVLRGATHVVNCTRGPRSVMIDGLRNVIAGCRTAEVRRFVHLSSVMVYGDPPHPNSHHEDAPTHPPAGTESYGSIKLEQDRMVQAAAAAGLPSMILCPPNISGPFSDYIVGIMNGLRDRSIALVDGGAAICNLVDVRNLCRAIELALYTESEALDGQRLFVTDGEAITWGDVAAELGEMCGHKVRHIDRDELRRLVEARSERKAPSLNASVRHLVSSDVRAALRKDPLLAGVDRAARTFVTRLGIGVENKLRRGIEGPTRVSRPDPYANLAVGLCAQQLRDVRHSIDRAKQMIGYQPPVSFRQSMADFRDWYRRMHGMDTPFWTLSSHLYGK